MVSSRSNWRKRCIPRDPAVGPTRIALTPLRKMVIIGGWNSPFLSRIQRSSTHWFQTGNGASSLYLTPAGSNDSVAVPSRSAGVDVSMMDVPKP